jgi:hypothetical protein
MRTRRKRARVVPLQADPTVRAFTPDSQAVFTAAARSVARALGREAAREYVAKMIEKRKVS